ncbi:MAG: DUF3667 domain-containing protein [Prevotella sp.]|nr:DUF3667 domain-containing protein [Prevotella sp.]
MKKVKDIIPKEKIRDWLDRYSRWRKDPSDYKSVRPKSFHCNNCGLDFEGSYCPRCGQKGGVGRIGWNTIREGLMDVWGLGNRSLPYSLWQLMWRPGYFVSDYISGRRQMSFPPVKMLFILTVIYAIVVEWFFPTVLGVQVDRDVESAAAKSTNEVTIMMTKYVKEYRAWTMLGVSMLMLLPMWVFFRYSPRHTRHTLPEGFFIMVFSCIIVLLFSIIGSCLHTISSSFSGFAGILMMATFFFMFRQLFGYGTWGTLWRLGGMFFNAIVIFVSLLAVGVAIYSVVKEGADGDEWSVIITVGAGAICILAINFALAYLLNRFAAKKGRGKF